MSRSQQRGQSTNNGIDEVPNGSLVVRKSQRASGVVREPLLSVEYGKRAPSVALARRYGVLTVGEAKSIARMWLDQMDLGKAVEFGLPEVDDRYHVWRVPLLNKSRKGNVGEVVIDARTSLIIEQRSTRREVIEARLLGRKEPSRGVRVSKELYPISPLRNSVIQGDSELALQELPAHSVDLVFTSPPYYNARPEYNDYITYEEYLLKIKKVIHHVHRVLGEGRFFVMNVSPVLVRRSSRNEASKRIAVPFDMHRLFIEEQFDFMDDIIWVKPEGAGWATGRGRRFAADRQPLQYKPVPVTEYLLVYRKRTDKLIDWNIRCHGDQQAVKESRISDGYATTNIWQIQPAFHSKHPAVFPLELAEEVISYYSFKNDVVLDPFAGVGTTGRAATKLNRRFVLIERETEYIDVIRQEIVEWMGKTAADVMFINCNPPDTSSCLF